MIFLKVFLVTILLLLIGGFTYFAITDVEVKQTEQIVTLNAGDFVE